jgi:gag-polypeptide of LTR copia-type
MSSNVASLVPILDGANYGIWSKAMKAYLMSLGLWGYADGTLEEPAADAATHPEWVQKNSMTMGNIVLRVNASIQQEVAELAAADTIWNRLLTLYGTSSPQGVYKDFKEALNIRLNGNQHPGPQIDKMAACFQRMTTASVPIPPQLQGMILLAAMPAKWEMLISICLTSLADVTDLDFKDARDTIVAQFETEQTRGSKGRQQQHANKLSAVKRKRGNQNFSNQESGGSQQKQEDRPKRKRGGRGKGKGKEQQGHAHTAQTSHIANVASLEAPTTHTIALPGPSGLQKRTVSQEKPKVRTPGPYKALNAAIDKAQEIGATPTIQTVKTLEQRITQQYEEGPWSRGDHTLGEEFDEDEDVDMSVVLPSAEGQEDWVFEEASPASPRDELLDWGSNEDLEECVALPFLYPTLFTKPPASRQRPSA